MTDGFKERYPTALMNTFGPPRLALVRGEGAHVWDEDGKEYVDFFGGIAVNALGHAHPALVEAVTTQLRTLGHVSNFFTSGPQVELAERLLGWFEPDGRVFVSNSGTEANEAALKMTRRTGRTRLVAMEGSFHGRTMGALALTSKAAYREPFEPLPGDVTFVPYGDADALAAAVDDSTAAVIVEPMQGEAGVVVPPEGFLPAAREITARHGALLWIDEVQTGVGRTGAWLAHTDSGVTPDIVTLAKGLGGGIPIGATIGLGAAASLLEPGNHGTTFGGNPVACAAALAVLDTIEKEGLMEAAVARGDQLRQLLTSQLAGGPGRRTRPAARRPAGRGDRCRGGGAGPGPGLPAQQHRAGPAAVRPAAHDHRGRHRRPRQRLGGHRDGGSGMKHFLADDDLSPDEQAVVLDLAALLKQVPFENQSLEGPRTVAMIFDKPTLRTQASFAAGIAELGGYPMLVDGTLAGIGKRESIADVARVLGRQAALIVWRTYEQARIEEMAAHAGVPVVNALTDDFHPCQLLADLQTVREHKGELAGLRVAFVGDGACNMGNSWLLAGATAGMHIVVGAPEDYRPSEEMFERARGDRERHRRLRRCRDGSQRRQSRTPTSW